MANQLKVMISSTARDLPEHRQKVMDACMRMGMFHPDMMEHLTATDTSALDISLDIVDRADIYVGVFGFRYGYVPDGQPISITEAEYNRAVERGIPRLMFLMSDDHLLKHADFETGNGAEKLDKLKERIKKERVVGFFNSADDLRAQVIQSLVLYRGSDLTALHHVSDIPSPPAAYIAHPYIMLQAPNLVGRQAEIKLLTDWITGKEFEADGRRIHADSVRIMNVVAIGGMGKSALTWKWFREIAPQEEKSLAGRMWWTFYESGATFENFVERALAYVVKRPLEEVQRIPGPEQETILLAALSQKPYLIVLDGLERILSAYPRMDAAQLNDSDFVKDKNVRKTLDPRVGKFLKKLAQVEKSRILVSSRLYPADLETDGGNPAPGSCECNLVGLTDADAVDLWRAFEVKGSSDELLLVSRTFQNYPLLIQALAGEVKQYKRKPGDFAEWRRANPQFDATKFPKLQDKMGHILQFALRGVDEIPYETLTALMIGKDKACADETELDIALTDLEDRKLVGRDKRENRYDLHPLVRAVVSKNLSDPMRQSVYSNLLSYFESLPKLTDYLGELILEDLAADIGQYRSLIGLERFNDAANLYIKQLDKPLSNRLSVSLVILELLELLFPNGIEKPPLVTDAEIQVTILNRLALAYQLSGKPHWAIGFFRRGLRICNEFDLKIGLSEGLGSMSNALLSCGALREAAYTALRILAVRGTLVDEVGQNNLRAELIGPERALTPEQRDRYSEGVGLTRLGMALAAMGSEWQSGIALQRAWRIDESLGDPQDQGVDNFYLAEQANWSGDYAKAFSFANIAWDLASQKKYERDFIRAARALGRAALRLEQPDDAEKRLSYALTHARAIHHVGEELPALVALAELRQSQRDFQAARELLNDVWELAESGPYPLFHADALNVLAQIERDEGNMAAAIQAATKAYRLAWCDGPPFAYHWGLEKAKQHLKELGAPEPEMPPFDESKFEPMPEVEIDPHDKFHAGGTAS